LRVRYWTDTVLCLILIKASWDAYHHVTYSRHAVGQRLRALGHKGFERFVEPGINRRHFTVAQHPFPGLVRPLRCILAAVIAPLLEGIDIDDERAQNAVSKLAIIQNFFGGVSIDGVKQELKFIYNALNTGRERTRNLTLPENIGYTAETPVELLAEAIRAYMADPNWIKTMAPKTAAKIRVWVNTHPELSRIIQFNSIGAGIAGAALGVGGQGNEANAAGAPSQQNPLRRFSEGANSIPPGPFGPAGNTAKASTYGLNKIVETLSQRGLDPQALGNEKLRGLVQALANLKATQDSQPRGGPR
jgi:hypothetical protein